MNEQIVEEVKRFYSQYSGMELVKEQIEKIFEQHGEEGYILLYKAIPVITKYVQKNPSQIERVVSKCLKMISGKVRKISKMEKIRFMVTGIADLYSDDSPCLSIFGVLDDDPQKLYVFQYQNILSESIESIYPNLGLGDRITMKLEFDKHRIYQKANIKDNFLEHGSLDEYEEWVNRYVPMVTIEKIAEALIKFNEERSDNIEDFKELSVILSNNEERPFINSVTEWRAIDGYISKVSKTRSGNYILVVDDGTLTTQIEFSSRYENPPKKVLTFGPEAVVFAPRYLVEKYNVSEGPATIVGQVRTDGFITAFGIIPYEDIEI